MTEKGLQIERVEHEHTDDDVLLFNVYLLALDATYSGAREELLDPLHPLVEQEGLMDDYEGFATQLCDYV